MNQTKKKNPLKRLLSMRGMGQVVTVTIGLIVLLVAFALINPNFWSPTNRTNLLRQIAPILIIGIAQSYVLITGNIDLSIGSVVGMSTMVAATLMSKGIMSPIPALLVTLLCCLLIGVLNGLLVAKFKLPPFIATLGTMTVARGIAQLVNGNYNTDSIMKFYHVAQLNRTLQQRCQVLRKNGCAIVPAQENCTGNSGSIHIEPPFWPNCSHRNASSWRLLLSNCS